ncbi:MAG: hypothetical protein LUD00_02390 [Prevotellaceae bacterium]|nr:hypothetical protein [Prevotellaceae bacterium]
MLPLDFPKWQLVYYYYRKWASQLNFDLLLEKLRGHVRLKRGQNMEPSVGIMDSQSVKWGNNASLNGVDGNNKRHKTSCHSRQERLSYCRYGYHCQYT